MADEHYSDSDEDGEWVTPRWIWEPLAEAIPGGFDLDAAAGCEPWDIATARFTPDDDALATPWYGDVWINPPYGRGINSEWAERVHEQAQQDYVDTVTALVPASTGTTWWQSYYATADVVTFLGGPDESGRVTFLNPDGEPADNNATFASCIASWGDFPLAYYRALADLGHLRAAATPEELENQ